jgi:hypothetical protein
MGVNIAVFTTVIVLLPMLYLLLASPAFLLVRLDVPEVAYLLRTMFFGYFLALVIAGCAATFLDGIYGRQVQALLIGIVTAFALVWRRWMMRRIDALIADTGAGLAEAAPRLRRLHWAGMVANAFQIAVILALTPSLAGTA